MPRLVGSPRVPHGRGCRRRDPACAETRTTHDRSTALLIQEQMFHVKHPGTFIAPPPDNPPRQPARDNNRHATTTGPLRRPERDTNRPVVATGARRRRFSRARAKTARLHLHFTPIPIPIPRPQRVNASTQTMRTNVSRETSGQRRPLRVRSRVDPQPLSRVYFQRTNRARMRAISRRNGAAMKAKMIHRCIHVLDLDASLAFYERALGLAVQRRMGTRRRIVGKRVPRQRKDRFPGGAHVEPRPHRALRQRRTRHAPGLRGDDMDARAPYTRRWAACAS